MTIREFKAEELPEQLSSEYGIMRPMPKTFGKKGQRKRSFTKDKDKKKKNRIQSLKKTQNQQQPSARDANNSSKEHSQINSTHGK